MRAPATAPARPQPVTATTTPSKPPPEPPTPAEVPAAVATERAEFQESNYVWPAKRGGAHEPGGRIDPATGMPRGIWLITGKEHPLVVLHAQPDPKWARDTPPEMEVVPIRSTKPTGPIGRVYSGTVIERAVDLERLPTALKAQSGRAVALENEEGVVCETTIDSLALIMLSNNQPDYFFRHIAKLDDAKVAALATNKVKSAEALWSIVGEHRQLLLVGHLKAPDAQCKGSVFARPLNAEPPTRFVRQPDIDARRSENLPPAIRRCLADLAKLPKYVSMEAEMQKDIAEMRAKGMKIVDGDEAAFEWTGVKQWKERNGSRELVLVQQGNDWENLWAVYETTGGKMRRLAHGTTEKSLSPDLILDATGDGVLEMLAFEFAFIPLKGTAEMIAVRTLCFGAECWG